MREARISSFPETFLLNKENGLRDNIMVLTSIIIIIPLSIVIGIIFLVIFLKASQNDQFDDMDGPKYRIFDDSDEDKK
jgi:cbb3-type cytochrome oxidase maturation protein